MIEITEEIQLVKFYLAKYRNGELTDRGYQRLIELLGLEKYNIPINH